jgi:DNA end-binding protein Ku
MKSIKNTTLWFDLVNIPVRMYKATDDHDIHFHRYHAASMSPIRQQWIAEGQVDKKGNPLVVTYADIIDGIEVDGQIVTVSKDEKRSLEEEADQGIQVLKFVPADDVDPILFEDSYYLEPNGHADGYVLLRQVLFESGRMAEVRFFYRSKEHRGVIRVVGDALVVHTMRWADEVRSTAELKLPAWTLPDPKKIKMAHLLVEANLGEFQVDEHTDGYTERLGEFISAKANDTEFAAAPESDHGTEDVSDLLAQLEASIAKRAKKTTRKTTKKESK